MKQTGRSENLIISGYVNELRRHTVSRLHYHAYKIRRERWRMKAILWEEMSWQIIIPKNGRTGDDKLNKKTSDSRTKTMRRKEKEGISSRHKNVNCIYFLMYLLFSVFLF